MRFPFQTSPLRQGARQAQVSGPDARWPRGGRESRDRDPLGGCPRQGERRSPTKPSPASPSRSLAATGARLAEPWRRLGESFPGRGALFTISFCSSGARSYPAGPAIETRHAGRGCGAAREAGGLRARLAAAPLTCGSAGRPSLHAPAPPALSPPPGCSISPPGLRLRAAPASAPGAGRIPPSGLPRSQSPETALALYPLLSLPFPRGCSRALPAGPPLPCSLHWAHHHAVFFASDPWRPTLQSKLATSKKYI